MRYFANTKAIKVIARRGIPLSLVFVFVWSIAGTAEAVSSWNPTLLVNTESFQEIDSGDGTTERELRFGDIDKKLMWQINENRFQFTRNVNVGGNLTATGSISASGALTTSGALKVDGTSALQGAVTFGDGTTTFVLPTARGSSGGILKLDASGTATWYVDDDTPESGDFGAAGDLDADGTITDGVIDEADLDAADSATDEDILTFEGTGFEWHSAAEMGIGTATSITDGLIVEPDLDADVAATDGDWLQYDSTGTNFTWRSSAELLTDVGQNGGTDITADLEEETHASEHASGGGDAVDHDTLTNFAANEHIDWTGATDNLATTGNLSGTTLNVDKNAFIFSKLAVSGSIVTDSNLAASGTLSVEGNVTTSGTLVVESTANIKGAVTFGDGATTYVLPTARGSNNQVLKSDASGNVTWGSDDGGTSFKAGQGLELGSTFFSLSNTFSGTSLEITGTSSGLTVHAQDMLQSSGALSVDGAASLQGAVTITEGALTDDTIVEGDLKAVDAAADEDFLTYESTTGDFEWHSVADVSANIAADIAEGELANDIILEEDIKAVDSASDEDILTYESTTGDFEWHSASDLGIGTATAITDGLIVEPDLDADNAAADGDWLQYDSTGTNFVWRSSAELLTDLGQDAGTDITADLEEETHASEHASGGGDAVDHDTLTNFVADEHIDWTAASDNFVTSGNVAASGTLSIEGTTSLKGALTLGDTITLPTTDGTRGQVLTTDGAGTVVWSGAVLGLGSGGVVALSPEYPNAVYFASGAITTTIGQMSYDYDETNNENFYRWASSKAALQEYWISARIRVPDNFKQFDTARPIQFRYRTTHASTDNNFLTMRLYDTGGTEVALTGGNDLANTSWTTATITGPDSAGTFTQGSYITVAVKLTSNSTGNADAGFINLNFETTAP
ncbi:TPA: hypothetical protein DE059_02160 [Candidatus Peribacteria bacterium]|nr:hypothetical protein [Candidatus Peribacteria bacterium]|tara:strand:- start:2919 stop:5657 length:2739 start_codon:yes stop_codon:yes gene_type:complete